MEIQLNATPHSVTPGLTLAQLLEELGVAPARVVVEMNGAIVTRENFAATALAQGDRLEIIRFVGGG